MKILEKIQTFKTDKEMDIFLNSLPKRSAFIRSAIFEKMQREGLVKEKKQLTLTDLKNSLNF